MNHIKLRINKEEKLFLYSQVIIITSVLLLILEFSFNSEKLQRFFELGDYIIIILFSIELFIKSTSLKKGYVKSPWFLFDLFLLLIGYVSFLRYHFKHPELVYVLRIFWILRVFKLFEVSEKMKQVEKKLLYVIPSVLTFAWLLFILIFVYAVIGIVLFENTKFESISFESLYDAMRTMFIFSTSGFDYGPIVDEVVNSYKKLPRIIIDIYFFSFYIFSAIIVMNVFLAVMTNNIFEESKSNTEKANSENQILQNKLDEILVALSKISKQENI